MSFTRCGAKKFATIGTGRGQNSGNQFEGKGKDSNNKCGKKGRKNALLTAKKIKKGREKVPRKN